MGKARSANLPHMAGWGSFRRVKGSLCQATLALDPPTLKTLKTTDQRRGKMWRQRWQWLTVC